MTKSSIFVPELLQNLGVLDWGYTEEAVPRSLENYETWVDNSQHGPLGYLSDHRRHLRGDLRYIFPQFQSALVFLFSYQSTKKWMLEQEKFAVAAYTLGFGGEDYHSVLRTRLTQITDSLDLTPDEYFLSIDAQPVLERDLAFRAGLGWFGKNSMLINKKEGSYFIIGSILLNRKLPLSMPTLDVDHCGQCLACVDACPTQAIDPVTRTLDAPKCISTFTIEVFKESNPPVGFTDSRGEIFGCDICQDVCPWNRKPLSRSRGELSIKEQFLFLTDWFLVWSKNGLREVIENFSNRGLRKKLVGTAFDRPGRTGWLKNLKG